MNNLLKNWNFMRLLRLALGIFILVEAVIERDFAIAVLGAAFTLMPVFNIGCCGPSGCNIRQPRNTKEKTKEINYEEVH